MSPGRDTPSATVATVRRENRPGRRDVRWAMDRIQGGCVRVSDLRPGKSAERDIVACPPPVVSKLGCTNLEPGRPAWSTYSTRRDTRGPLHPNRPVPGRARV